ncbi:DNA topoisomerase 3 (plasmid) [Piscirickettsia salmonis]|nr:DNA topoisomerase 3 [Piscirickettsia salmonis]
MLDKANHVYIATDFDREGEAIARSLLERCRYRGNIQRVCLTALDPTSIKRALKKIKSGHETVPLYHAALARQRADWLVGMNLTRLYTDICRKLGHDEIIQIGRVLTPTVTMVCNRDEVIKNFEPKPYYTIEALVNVVNGQFKAFWQAPSHVIDGQKRCINQDYAQNVAVAVKGQTVQIAKAETKPAKQTAPLPFDLTSLQQYASKRWGYTAKKTLEACQKLYDEQAISYPRTDSRYIPVSQYDDAPAILNAISMSDPDMLKLTKCADVTHKGRAFNDKKTTAHHAIIPTMVNATVGQFSLEERNLYGVVCRFYLAQFYPDFCFMRTEIEVICKQERFVAKGKMPTELGWKRVIELPKKEKNDNEDEQEQSNLPQVQAGDDANIIDVLLQNKMTKPPAHHTEASLLSSMENIAKLAEDDRFKKILKETSGIGTPATRAGIIQGAVDRGYLIREKKSMKATDKAYMLLKLIPKSIKSPELTAAWEQELEKVATGEVELDKFLNDISGWLNKLVTRVIADTVELTF